MRYNFDWDPNKERQNIRKHKLAFRRAATVFRDPNHISIYDEAHSETEDRWITIGVDQNGIIQVVVHTFEHIDKNTFEIRIISARKATRKEETQYMESAL
jgi:hypothetical protein